jgi:glycosyltransferase involved in cell wall biosynthesis
MEANREWQVHHQDTGFPVSVLSGKSLYLGRWEFPIHLNRGLGRALKAQKPDVVMVAGWDQLAYWQAAWWCKRSRVPLVLHNGSTNTSGLHRGQPWRTIRRLMIRMASTYVAYGSLARDYLMELGAREDRIHIGFNTVDMDAIAAAVQAERAEPETRAKRASYPPILLLYVGRLIPLKRVDLILQALANLGSDDIGLVIVGSGRAEAGLRERTGALGLRHVYFEGFHQPEALPHYYALADALVIPSDREVWGLVVNEALASGLYVIASDQVGAACDTLLSGWNGDTFTAGDATDLAEQIGQLRQRIGEVRQRRKAIVADATSRLGIHQLAGAFSAAFRHAAERQV